MDRRSFLKGVGLVSAAGVAGAAVASGGGSAAELVRRGREVRSGAAIYRIDGGPRVFVSRDDGATWSQHANLGERYGIRGIRTDARGRVRITVAYQRRAFDLVLAKSERAWLVA